jgi:ribosome-associated heat shock protein Hsp15
MTASTEGHVVDSARVDSWLWAIRLYRTRSEAGAACRSGHVRVNGRTAKAATAVRVGDTVEARVHGRRRIVEVTRVIHKRVGAPTAADCHRDLSPPAADHQPGAAQAVRDRGAGRPTKRERRRLERWRSR